MNHRSVIVTILCAGALVAGACDEPGHTHDTGDTDTDTGKPQEHVDCSEAEPETICVPTASDALLFAAIRSIDDGESHTVQLFRATPDGASAVQLTPDGPDAPTDSHNEAVRSPDGQTVVFVSGHEWEVSAGDPTRGSLYAVNADGTGLRKVTDNLPMDCREWGPRFSPDGEWLLFSRACRYDERPEFENLEFLFRVRLDGTDQERLVDAEAAHPDPLGFGAWSHDGLTVYATEFRTATAWGALVAYDVPTGQVTEVWNNSADDRFVSRWPMVLPDGDLLVLTDGWNEDHEARLERIDIDTLEHTTVRHIDKNSYSARVDADFALSPDGTQVAYVHTTMAENPVSSSDFTQTIQVSNLDGSEARDVTEPLRFIRWVTWNPAPEE